MEQEINIQDYVLELEAEIATIGKEKVAMRTLLKAISKRNKELEESLSEKEKEDLEGGDEKC